VILHLYDPVLIRVLWLGNIPHKTKKIWLEKEQLEPTTFAVGARRTVRGNAALTLLSKNASELTSFDTRLPLSLCLSQFRHA